ncbi:DUF411 domain-containing protein [Aromatoleum toluclasticum]|uniref:DUF411 domain-containing protein n=1 Tax=Aromatoleum toluclasticum TaxID=92003 RepID=UPI000360C9D0|nr:DUF411 domain-containing protein [Aromatoleum toluclasticum]MCC4115486.1 DUF411 domain-containing protein [Aromatoleum toluclasticum]
MKSHTPSRSARRPFAALSALAALALAAAFSAPVLAAGEEVVMYKDPNCGCCGKWAEHMREAGFKVKEVRSSDMGTIKREAGVPQAQTSCHTAKVGGYFVEGHVPAADVKRLLAEKPKVVGISAPGMPQGSPGMEGPYPADRYKVVSVAADGKTSVFASH